MPTSSSPEDTDAQHATPSRPRSARPCAPLTRSQRARARPLPRRTAAGQPCARHRPLDAGLWLALARDYQRHELPWQAAYAARQALRSDPGVRSLSQLDALALGDRYDPATGDAQLGQPRLAHAATLIEHFEVRTRERPDDWLTWLYLARLQDMRAAERSAPDTPGAPDPTPASARDAALAQARQHEILPGESLHWLGVWRLNAGDAAGAVDALSALIDNRPPRYGSLMYLGEALLRSDRIAAAETAVSRASQSANPDFLSDLAARVYAHNYWREAIALLQKALSLRPEHVPTRIALARIQSEVHRLADCRDSLARIARLAPGQPEAALLTAGLHGRLGDARSQRLAQQELLAANDDPLSRLASSIAMTALYDDSLTAREIAALHRQLCAPIEAALPERTAFPNPRTTQRRLRIGYVTGDLHRQHPVNLFMLPVLGRHDHRRCDITVYHTGRMFDAYTRRAQAARRERMVRRSANAQGEKLSSQAVAVRFARREKAVATFLMALAISRTSASEKLLR
ncbi:MAG: tetratricopeptide repeat protein [Accumulibacter sp.]|uniref:tetratricopeptide repeat protein n=1 Tax=Accumulibacter sp. TaxID=2053492 RepID=UPI002FC3DB44